MRIRGLLMIGLASLLMTNVYGAKPVKKMGDIYKARCSNCHGIKANGVPKLKEQSEMTVEEASAQGTASQEKNNIYGPPLTVYTKDEIYHKLMDLRSKDFDSESYHSIMRKNLKLIEDREGKISDEKMAEYIFTTFGSK
jgi:cytochrome c553